MRFDSDEFIEAAVRQYGAKYEGLTAICQWLAKQCQVPYRRVETSRSNPRTHHFTVFAHALEIGDRLGLNGQYMLRLLTAALTHDAGSAEVKITTQEVRQLKAVDPEAAAAKELERTAARLAHMFQNALFALDLMERANAAVAPVYDQDNLIEISQVIARHDALSLGQNVPLDEVVFAVLVECDSLWVVSFPDGPRADLWRERGGLWRAGLSQEEQTDEDYRQALRRQVISNILLLRSRRKSLTGNFQGKTCLRHEASYPVYQRYLEQWTRFFDASSGLLEEEADEEQSRREAERKQR